MALEDIQEQVGLHRCDRCYRIKAVGELVEDEGSPGLIVCKECFERKGFSEVKAENPKDRYDNHFKT